MAMTSESVPGQIAALARATLRGSPFQSGGSLSRFPNRTDCALARCHRDIVMVDKTAAVRRQNSRREVVIES